MGIVFLVIAAFVLLVLARSVRIASEWQRAVILRLGRFHMVAGPGLYFVLPVIDAVAQVIDLRIQTTMITAEQALTRDTVAVGVDAIVFWQVENAETAAAGTCRISRSVLPRRRSFARILLSSSYPFISGRPMSLINTSIGSLCMIRSASKPSLAGVTCAP